MNTQCKCGTTYISKTTDLLINGSSQPIALNTADLLGYPKDILLESGQVFSTATNKIISQIGGGASNSVVFNSKLVIDNQIKIVLKIASGKILGVKYIGTSGKRTIVDNIVFTSSDLIPYLLNEERLIVQIYSMCDMSTPDCCDKLPDFTVQSIVNNFCIPPTTTTTTTLPPTTTGTTTTGTTTTGTTTTGTTTTGTTTTGTTTTGTTTTGTTTTGTTTTGTTTTGTTTTGTTTTGTTTTGTTTTGTTTTGTTTTGTTTTGTTTTGTTTTGTTTTGTTTTGTTTTCAPWPSLPCVSASCSYTTGFTLDGLFLEIGELQEYIAENPCYSGEEVLNSQAPCSFFDCLWVSVYDGNNPPAWQFVTGACEAYNNNCGGNCGTCNFPSELPPLEDGIYTSTKCSCVS
jgi:hypothetical protein